MVTEKAIDHPEAYESGVKERFWIKSAALSRMYKPKGSEK